MDHRFVVLQGFATPIRRDEGKQAVLDLVPFAGPRRKMAHPQGKTRFVGKFLQFQLPQAQPPPVAAPAIGRNQNPRSLGIESFPFLTPPASDGGHGEGSGVMIGPDVDKPEVTPDIVNTVGIGPRYSGCGKVMPTNLPRLSGGKPLLASIGVIAEQFFLLGIDRDHRTTPSQPALHFGTDLTELRVAV